NPIADTLQHFSGSAPAQSIATDTGTLAMSSVARRIAWGEVSPSTGLEWVPVIAGAPPAASTPTAEPSRGTPTLLGDEDAQKRGSSGAPGGTSGTTRKNPRRTVSHDTNNYSRHGFSRLPDDGEDFSRWTVPQLREFLSVFRCLDNAGTSGLNKALLSTIAGDVVRMIRKCGLLDTNLAFRHPVADTTSFEDKERMIMPDLPAISHRIPEWPVVRRHLPEISKSFILQFIQRVNPLAQEGSRVWYRALQRTMDMGNLGKIWAVPAQEGVMWLGTR
ncbi:unnamed protein product, partial [Pylaiella littoralis]